jgi:hypothetical protein
MSYTTVSSTARPPLTTQSFRHGGHSSRFPAPLAGSGLSEKGVTLAQTMQRAHELLWENS